MTDLLILTDGGGDIGFGHLMRCLAIKDAWHYGSARLLAQMEGDSKVPDGVEIVDWIENSRKIQQFTTENTVLLVDSYRPDAEFFRLIKSMFSFVAVLDDYNRISYQVDLIICPGIYGNEMDYSNQSAMAVGGPDYVVIRPEIVTAKQVETRESIGSVLVTFGGSQRDEKLYQYVNDLLEEAGYQVIVVTGNDHIAAKLRTKASQVYGKLEPSTMSELMTLVDIAVSAAGQTVNELAWLGVPTIAVKTGEDQHGNWDFYKRHNLSLASLLPEQPNFAMIMLSSLDSATSDSRKKLSYKLKKMFSGTGATRVCSLIHNSGSLI